MRTYDITLTISPDLVVWPGDPAIELKRVDKIEEGANANVSRMNMGVHTGTQVAGTGATCEATAEADGSLTPPAVP